MGTTQKMTITIIGGGLSGIMTAHFIRKARPTAKINLYEASYRLGGRIFTKNVDNLGPVEVGAQYINFNKNELNKVQKSMVDWLVDEKLLLPYDIPKEANEPKQYGKEVCLIPNSQTGGFDGVIDKILKTIETDNFNINLNTRVENLNQISLTENVIFALPIHLAINILKNSQLFKFINPKTQESLQNVQYSKRFALVLYYSNEILPFLSLGPKYYKNNFEKVQNGDKSNYKELLDEYLSLASVNEIDHS